MNGIEPGRPSDPVTTAGAGMALDRLQRLLQRQLELVRQGRLAAAVELFEQTDQCVREIALVREPGTTGVPGRTSVAAHELWPEIERLYQELSVALTAQRTEVKAALTTIQRGRKVLKTYGSYLSSQ